MRKYTVIRGFPPGNCLQGGCAAYHEGLMNKDTEVGAMCMGCGFDRAEAERRKGLPTVTGSDGMRRMIVHRSEEAKTGE